jgi:spoIIIJ-associated protein
MSDVAEKARQFLNELFTLARLDLKAEPSDESNGLVINIDGNDAPLLRGEGGEVLDAVEHLLNQAYSRELPQNQHLVCDVQGFRDIRETELRVMARHAAERVLATGVTFTFGPMNANERRIIHTALSGEEKLFTESVGEGSERRLRVSLKKSV